MTDATGLAAEARGAVRLLVVRKAASTIGVACYAVGVPSYILASSNGLSTLGTAHGTEGAMGRETALRSRVRRVGVGQPEWNWNFSPRETASA